MDLPKLPKQYLLSVIAMSLLSACTSNNMENSSDVKHQTVYQSYRPMFIQNHVDALADSLVAHSQKNFKLGRIAVGSISMLDTFKVEADNTHQLAKLGNQLQESLMTSMLQRGYRVVEYRASNDIIIHDNQDQMLTRDLKQLTAVDEFNYFLTGTIKYQENGAVVNVKVIDLLNNELVSASTKFIPGDVFWDNRQATSTDGMIYRSSYRGNE